jgi:undecaprenyldiphospho-muramoylpentapeptide beta-N-acetylglucosaminyltransferase
VYPALAVVGALVANSESVKVLWVGGEGGMEASLVARAGIDYRAIPAAGLHGVGPLAFPGNLLRMLRGVSASRTILRQFRPEALFFTGGYVGVPVSFTGRHLPQAVYVPDIEPALALRWISRRAKTIAVTTEASRGHYSGDRNVLVVGYPTRRELQPGSKSASRQALGLDPDLGTVLVFGGSRGARSINQALWKCLPELLEQMQVIHITGQLDWGDVAACQAALEPEQRSRYRPYPYVHDEMSHVFSAADLVVSRAGAAVLGEYPLFGLPALLVPYPHAWRYQQVNARHLEQHGAARILKDEELEHHLADQIRTLMSDPGGRDRMSAAMRALHNPNAAERIARILNELPGHMEASGG